MTTEVRTPLSVSLIELSDGGLWRKQVLKFGSIWYADPRTGQQRRITFDRKYGEDLVRAFKDGAYAQVPLQFADGDNRHNNDPLRTHGEVVGLQLSADGSGVDGILRTWGPGAAVIEHNPNLGVSARILENLSTSDGRTFPRAVQHVLATVDPQVRGMSPWKRVQSVDLSNATGAETVDLFAAKYERSAGMPTSDEGTTTLELSSGLAALLQKPGAAERLERMIEDDEALEALVDEFGEEFFDDDEDDDGEVLAELDEEGDVDLSASSVYAEVLELAQATQDAQGQQIVELTNRLNTQRLDGEVQEYTRQGLAPAVLNLARPLLAMAPGAIELSNGVAGQEVDPAGVIREVLDSVIDLANSGHLLVDSDQETGSLHGSDKASSNRKALLDDWATYDA